MNSLKEKLIYTGLFTDNEWLAKYVELITQNKSQQVIKGKTQKHHILQKAYYRHNNLEIDDSEENCVNLLYKYHVLAHYYLVKCTTDYLKFSNQVCLHRMIKHKNFIGEEDILTMMDDLQLLYEQYIQLDSQLNSGHNNGNYGNYWSDDQKAKASIERKQFYQSKQGLEVLNKLSQLQKGKSPDNKGKNAYYSITEQKVIYSDECPDGYTNIAPQWYRDKTKDSKYINNHITTKDFHWYTNGDDDIFCKTTDIPDGYHKGRVGGKSCTTKGKTAYHNKDGKIIYINNDDEIPVGFVIGTGVKPNVSGELNSSFGRHWFTDGEVNIHNKVELQQCPSGFRIGQTRGKQSFTLDNYIKMKEVNQK